MPSTINASTSAGIVQTADTSGVLQLQTASTTALTVDASQNVGIGTASPTSKFVVSNGGAAGFEINPTGTASSPVLISYNRSGAAYLQLSYAALQHIWSNSGTEVMRIDSSGNVGIGTSSPNKTGFTAPVLSITNGTSGILELVGTQASTGTIGQIAFYNTSSTTRLGQILLTATASNSGALTFQTTNAGSLAEAMRINSNGNIALAGGTTTASGVGITFPATQVASSDANCLDDYEEGTWTPSVGGNATYLIQQARYTKIGNTVYVECDLQINVLGSGSPSVISGLPFAINATTSGGITVGYFSGLAIALYFISGNLNTSSTSIVMSSTTGSTATINYPSGVFGNGGRVKFTGFYSV